MCRGLNANARSETNFRARNRSVFNEFHGSSPAQQPSSSVQYSQPFAGKVSSVNVDGAGGMSKVDWADEMSMTANQDQAAKSGICLCPLPTDSQLLGPRWQTAPSPGRRALRYLTPMKPEVMSLRSLEFWSTNLRSATVWHHLQLNTSFPNFPSPRHTSQYAKSQIEEPQQASAPKDIQPFVRERAEAKWQKISYSLPGQKSGQGWSKPPGTMKSLFAIQPTKETLDPDNSRGHCGKVTLTAETHLDSVGHWKPSGRWKENSCAISSQAWRRDDDETATACIELCQ